MTLDQKFVAEVERTVLARVAAGHVEVPPIDLVAMNCLDILRKRDFSHRVLVGQLERDPMIAALVMKTANAAIQGQSVSTLDQAVLRLGAAQLETVILECAARKVFVANGPFAAANRRIWEHSVQVARLSRGLASSLGRRDADTYYLAGLLHDIGKPVIAALLMATARKVAPGIKPWLDLAIWDRVILDCNYRAAQMVAKAWHLPAMVAIGQESDFDLGEPKSVANVVRISNALAKQLGFVTGPVDNDQVAATVARGAMILGLDPAAIGVIANATQEASV